MTEKRFVLNNIVKKGTVSFWDTEKEKILNASHTLDLLNQLSDENEELKKEIETLNLNVLRLTEKINDCRVILND